MESAMTTNLAAYIGLVFSKIWALLGSVTIPGTTGSFRDLYVGFIAAMLGVMILRMVTGVGFLGAWVAGDLALSRSKRPRYSSALVPVERRHDEK